MAVACFEAAFVALDAAVCFAAGVFGACFEVAGDLAGPDGLGRADPSLDAGVAPLVDLALSAGDLEAVVVTFEGVTTFPKLEDGMMPEGAAKRMAHNSGWHTNG